MAAGKIDGIPASDILHCNDWQTALAPVFLQQLGARPKTVFTIHNLAYQGVFPRNDFERLGLWESLWQFSHLEFYGKFSFIKGGIVFSDIVTTVSPQYRHEILTPEFGCGLDGCLNHHREKLFGILNGIDTITWNPETDPDIDQHFNVKTLRSRKENKHALINRFHLSKRKHTLLVGFIGRLADQKGLDLLREALPQLLEMPVQVIFLGSGEQHYCDYIDSVRNDHSGDIGTHFGYDEGMAHQLVAGLDALLIPSRYEPCGLTQMYAMRYGCVPIAHGVGGLVDTIVDVNASTEVPATGFLFRDYRVATLLTTIERAIAVYRNDKAWRTLQINGMNRDNSWTKSAREYADIYRKLMGQQTLASKKDLGKNAQLLKILI